METLSVNVRRVGPPESWYGGAEAARPALDLEADLRRARWLANWLDAKFSFLGVRFGLDALVGLVPVVGDTLTALAGLFPVWVAKRHGFSATLQARMALNVALDYIPGLIPVVGDVIDVGFKSNLKNVALLERAVEKRRAAARD
jgi:hypothetical protein